MKKKNWGFGNDPNSTHNVTPTEANNVCTCINPNLKFKFFKITQEAYDH